MVDYFIRSKPSHSHFRPHMPSHSHFRPHMPSYSHFRPLIVGAWTSGHGPSLPPAPYLGAGHGVGGKEIAVLLQKQRVRHEGQDLSHKRQRLLLQRLGVTCCHPRREPGRARPCHEFPLFEPFSFLPT